MTKSIFSELYVKSVKSGNPLYLFIAINTIVFLAINLLGVGEFLFTRYTPIADWITYQLSMPAYLPKLPYKFWTILTYMFSHREFFHLLFNMLWLYWMGKIFLDFLNKRQFIFTYLAGGLSGALFFILFFNIFPAFSDSYSSATIIGASASVMAIVVATATLLPDYAIRLLLLGDVRLKYLATAYIVMDILSIAKANAGGSISHLGGALLGFIYITQLRKGNDWSKLFQKKPKLKVVQNNNHKPVSKSTKLPDQEVIDLILDKISRSGYESLSKSEKEQLFNASKKE